MSQEKLTRFVEAKATELGVPGVSVGVWAGNRATYVSHGVTSVDAPLPVDQHTVFQLGSISKSFTATALMRLVADGLVELNAPVRRYVPELKLADEQSAEKITVLQLLNHTAGLDWRFGAETGEGDDALAAYVARLEEAELVGPPGGRSSYGPGRCRAGRSACSGLRAFTAGAPSLASPPALPLGREDLAPVFGGADEVLADAVEEPAHVREPDAGGGAGAEFAGAFLGGLGECGVHAGAGQHGPEPDVLVDDVPVAPLAGVPLPQDQLLSLQVADGLGDRRGADPKPPTQLCSGEAAGL